MKNFLSSMLPMEPHFRSSGGAYDGVIARTKLNFLWVKMSRAKQSSGCWDRFCRHRDRIKNISRNALLKKLHKLQLNL